MPPARRFPLFWPAALLCAALLLGQQFARNAWLYVHVLTPRVMDPFASCSKLASQLAGCVLAAGCARNYERGNPVRPAWWLLSAWLGADFVGQAILSFYLYGLGRMAPVPSLADVAFFAGYMCVIPALFLFIRAYRESGFDVGNPRALLLLGGCAAVVFAVAAGLVLVPVALAPTPFAERLVNVAYPFGDFVLLIPALVLLRMTLRLRGGKLWPVWATLLAGIVFGAGGDIVWTDSTPAYQEAWGPVADLLFVLSYAFSARGIWLEHALLRE